MDFNCPVLDLVLEFVEYHTQVGLVWCLVRVVAG